MQKTKSKSQTIERAFLIFDELMKGPQEIGVLAERCELTYSTAYRIIQFLYQQGYLRKADSKKFALGTKLIQLGFRAYESTNLVNLARPYLEKLSELTSDTVHLAVEESSEVVYLDKIDGQRSVTISSRIGGRKKLYNTGVGKALLLLKSPEELAYIFSSEGGDPEAKRDFLALMEKYKKLGYALDLGEDSANIRCVAAPIKSRSDCITAAISVSSTVEYMDDSRMMQLVDVLKNVAKDISAEVYGYSQG